MTWINLSGLLLSLLLLFGCQNLQPTQAPQVQVERVVSGQTLEVINSQGAIQRVRLVGIEAPDLKQVPWGSQAKQRLEELISNRPVVLDSVEGQSDRYQRSLAFVWVAGHLLNEQLVAEGLVLAAPDQRIDKRSGMQQRLQHAQEKARLLGLGIWNPQAPLQLTPAEFRAQAR